MLEDMNPNLTSPTLHKRWSLWLKNNNNSESHQCPQSNSITLEQRIDGFGAHYSALISVFAYAKYYGIPYCITSWNKIMAHDVDGENLFDFIGGKLYGPPANVNTTRFEHKHIDMSFKYQDLKDTWELVRSFYFSTEKPALDWYKDESAFHIAVHVRRGDIHPNKKDSGWVLDGEMVNVGRYTNDDVISRCVHTIAASPKHKGKTIYVHLVSEGPVNKFRSLIDKLSKRDIKAVKLHLNIDLRVAFHHLVSADALVMAKSSLSWAAAYVSAGEIYSTYRRNHRIQLCDLEDLINKPDGKLTALHVAKPTSTEAAVLVVVLFLIYLFIKKRIQGSKRV